MEYGSNARLDFYPHRPSLIPQPNLERRCSTCGRKLYPIWGKEVGEEGVVHVRWDEGSCKYHYRCANGHENSEGDAGSIFMLLEMLSYLTANRRAYLLSAKVNSVAHGGITDMHFFMPPPGQ